MSPRSTAATNPSAVSTGHLDDLRAQARCARQRYNVYKAYACGQRAAGAAGCASSNEPAGRQKHVFAPLMHRSGGLALWTTARRVVGWVWMRSPPGARRGLGLDALAARPHAVLGNAYAADCGPIWLLTGALSAAEAPVKVQQGGLLYKLAESRPAAQTAATFGTSGAGPPEAIATR
jgi:hypothetical protein